MSLDPTSGVNTKPGPDPEKLKLEQEISGSDDEVVDKDNNKIFLAIVSIVAIGLAIYFLFFF